ncbi:hypothetical protein DAPPUDRAFT_113060 [Daphnia pulex]|uniref:Uncharacterized protein n=1 Tax=Daphnia pulex TaxID=6669 RepID=E9HDZ4_DAPPU|nr:hypothetical protein DAPPUDRAFT_113060 [Daphnia pulex]|eukprot:EFX70009.1 hypothetical protein DAPPUDRAFT_113060 [Daphnia pulex]
MEYPIVDQPSITVSVGLSVNFIISQSDHQQLVDWNSRYDVPLSLREDTVELLQRAVAPVGPVTERPLVPYDDDSSNEDDEVDEPFKKGLMSCYGITKRRRIHSRKLPTYLQNNTDESLQAEIVAAVKNEVAQNVFATAKQVVEPIFLQHFEKDPERNLPVLYNVTRAAQRQQEKSYPKNPLNLEFDWETDKGLISMTTGQPLRHLTLKHMALIKERLGTHVAASHPKQFFILPGFFAQLTGSKRGRVVAMATKHAFDYSRPILQI